MIMCVFEIASSCMATTWVHPWDLFSFDVLLSDLNRDDCRGWNIFVF